MGALNVGSKGGRYFSNDLGIWTKFCLAMGALIVARKSPIAVLGCREVDIFPHAQESTPNSDSPLDTYKILDAKAGHGMSSPFFTHCIASHKPWQLPNSIP